MDREPQEPSEPIDWGPRRSVWEWEEPAPEPPPRRWLLAITLLLLLGGVGVAVAIAVASRGSGTPPTAPPRPPSIPTFLAMATSPVEVTLRWTALGDPVEYLVYRDGRRLATVAAPGLTYTDASVAPDTTYVYGIEAVVGVDLQSDRVTATVATPVAPPITEARLEGAWDVTLTYVEENYTNRKKGDTEQETWSFEPRCGSGACDVSVNLFYPEQEETVLERDGGVYRGEGTAMLDRCEGARLPTVLVLEVNVTAAEFVDGVWTATGFVGSLETNSEAALGCRPGHSLRSLEGQGRV